MTEQEVIKMIAETLEIPVEQMTVDSKGADFPEWDSIGVLSIVAELDGRGIQIDPGDAATLNTVNAVIDVVRAAGKIQ